MAGLAGFKRFFTSLFDRDRSNFGFSSPSINIRNFSYKAPLRNFIRTKDYKALPKNWADDPYIEESAMRLYQDYGVGTPFFEAWWNNSPLPKGKQWYHGTQGESFDRFDPKYGPTGIISAFTSDNPEIATSYIPGVMRDWIKPLGLYIKGTNPVSFNANKLRFHMADHATLENISPTVLENIRKKIPNYSIGDNGYPLINYKDAYIYHTKHPTDLISSSLFRNYGADTVQFRNLIDPGDYGYEIPSNVLIAKNPSQIKSVDNIGTFDPKDLNIFHGFAAPVGLAAMKAVDPPLEDAWNPFETLVSAPVGVAGLANKGLAIASDAIMQNLPIERYLPKVGKFFNSGTQNQQPRNLMFGE